MIFYYTSRQRDNLKKYYLIPGKCTSYINISIMTSRDDQNYNLYLGRVLFRLVIYIVIHQA